MHEELISQLKEATGTILTMKQGQEALARQVEALGLAQDRTEAMIKRVEGTPEKPQAVGIETEYGRGELPIYRKNHSLVEALHGQQGLAKAREISLGRLLKGVAVGNWRNADAEHELVRTKGQSISSGPGGGFLLPDLVDSMILDIARPQSVTQRMGAGVVNVQGFTALPRLTGDVTPVWRGNDYSEITESTMAFGTINVQPRTVGFIVRASRELLQDSGPELDQFVRQVFSAAYAAELDRVTLAGGGITEPTGILNTTGVNPLPIGGAVDWDDLIDGAREVYEANFAGEYRELGIVLNPRTWAALAKLKGTANDHYLQAPEPVREMQRAQTMHLAVDGSSNTNAIVGDFRQVAIAQRVGLSIDVSGQEGDTFKKNQIAIRGVARVDVAVFRPAWFTVLTGISN